MNTNNILGLRGRSVLITGAGRGVGRVHALGLADLGMHVVVNDIASVDATTGRTVADDVVAEIESRGGVAFACSLDISHWGAAEELVAFTVAKTGRLDGIVNNAGIIHQGRLVDLDEQTFNTVMAVHLGGTIGCTVAALKYWTSSGHSLRHGASIVNTISESMFVAQPGLTSYMVAKSAIAELTLVTSREARALGVRANAYGPRGRTRMSTDAQQGLGAEVEGTIRDPANSTPLVAWLLSPESVHVTGQLLYMVGGAIGRVSAWVPEPLVWPYEGHRFAYDEVGPAVNSHVFSSRYPERALIDPQNIDAGFKRLRTRDARSAPNEERS
jgi:NAD(P)-dependent dehydrogenase (short-subunit alcohol dehydrogenase family)